MNVEFKGTPGPWRWELNLKSKDLQLCGHGECGPYDFIVMDFERWGMGGAVPRFREGDQNTMVKAFEFAKAVPKREHHKEWFQTISHADATLIECAPQLLKALMLLFNEVIADFEPGQEMSKAEKMAQDIIYKALGNA